MSNQKFSWKAIKNLVVGTEEDAVVAKIELTLEGGVEAYVETQEEGAETVMTGDKLYIKDEAGNYAEAPAKDYMHNGQVMTVGEGGVITEIKDVAAENEADLDVDAKLDLLGAMLSKVLDENESIKAELAEIKEAKAEVQNKRTTVLNRATPKPKVDKNPGKEKVATGWDVFHNSLMGRYKNN